MAISQNPEIGSAPNLAGKQIILCLIQRREYREANEEFKFLDETHTIKTLGVVWNPSSDKFTFTVSHLSNDLDEATITKRKMLSDIAKIFDPLGWLSPVSLELKHLMQQVWQCRVDWDQKLPTELTTAYLDWRRKLEALN